MGHKQCPCTPRMRRCARCNGEEQMRRTSMTAEDFLGFLEAETRRIGFESGLYSRVMVCKAPARTKGRIYICFIPRQMGGSFHKCVFVQDRAASTMTKATFKTSESIGTFALRTSSRRTPHTLMNQIIIGITAKLAGN